MKTTVTQLCLFVVLLCTVGVAQVKRYDGRVEMRPSTGEITADIKVTLVARKSTAFQTFYLNKALRVESFQCAVCSSHSFDLGKSGEYRYVQNGAPLTVTFKRPLRTGEKAHIRLRYSGKLAPNPWGVNMLTPEWTELALYSSWYPYAPEAADFGYDLRVKIDPAYTIAGNGEVTGAKGEWRIRESEPTSDIVLIAARDLRQRTIEKSGVRLSIGYLPVHEAAVESLAAETSVMLDRYGEWFGSAPLHEARIVLNLRKQGGAYVRPRFMSMPLTVGESKQQEDRSWLAHEVAHFWWTGAPVANWEDWLNESFAQYSSLMYLRETKGEQEFERRIERIRRDTAAAPPIWGIDRNSEKAHLVLYEKGALRLWQLEQMLGRPKFRDFLASLQREHVRSTDGLLILLQQQGSPEIRERFERLLKDAAD